MTGPAHRRYTSGTFNIHRGVHSPAMADETTHRPELSDAVFDRAAEVRDENGYVSIDRALKHIMREAGYDV